MLKIGEFSKLAQISVKTLRYYGELKLLKPARIDRFTGYRYYTLDQLPRLNRIVALKDLGFSLDQIRQLLKDDLPLAELRGMLKLKYGELERQVEEEQARLARVTTRLQQIEQEGRVPRYEVVLKQVPPQRVAGIRRVVTRPQEIQQALDELCAGLKIAALGADGDCPATVLYYDTEYRDRGIDVEAAVPCTTALDGGPQVTVHTLPGVAEMACTVHVGSLETLPQAYQAVLTWIDANGYRVAGPNRDLYLRRTGPHDPVAQTLTEVQFPVQKRIYSLLTQKGKTMEPKIIEKPAFTVVGLKYHGKNQHDEIGQLWQQLMPRAAEIKHRVEFNAAYGVCSAIKEEDGAFDYIAGYAVSEATDLPEGMGSQAIPAQTYAVFPCTLHTIKETYTYAFETWLPQSGREWAKGPDFEYYDESFDPGVEDPEMYIYVPIK